MRPRLRGPYREQALRYSTAKRLIESPRVQRYRHRGRFVFRGIVEFAVDHDNDWNQMGFTVRREFNQSRGSRTFVRRLAMGALREYNLDGEEHDRRENDRR